MRKLLLAAILIWFALGASLQAQTITLAVLAKRGEEATVKRWKPLVDYLNYTIPYEVKLLPLSFEALKEAVKKGEVDLVLANPGMYVELEVCCGLSPVVTMKNLKLKKAYTRFGGVIFTRSDRKDLDHFEDFKRIRPLVGAVNPDSFGGWLMQWREFTRAGLKRGRDFKVRFYGTHDAVVYAVLKGEVEVGCVRTDTLETMAEEGKIRLEDFRVLNPQKHPGFDLWISTPLYPEWPLARSPTIRDEVAEVIASVLLALPRESIVARATGAAWTIPHNYRPVHECLQELGVGPYAELKARLLREARKKYLRIIAFLVVLFLVASSVTLYILSLNRRLKGAYAEIRRHRNHLEEKVKERTRHLEEITRRLEKEVKERRRAELKVSQERERLAVVLRSLAEAVIVTDPQGRITLLNPEAEKLLEIKAKEALGKRLCDLISIEVEEEEPQPSVISPPSNGFIAFLEARVRLPSGKEIIVEGAAAPVHDEFSKVSGTVMVLRDISERKRLEEEALRTSRLETLRLLASGVAHDFNNLLATIIGYLNVIRLKLKDPELKETLDRAEQACLTARTLTRELLTHTTGGGPVPRLVSLKDILQETINFALSGSKTKAQTDIPPELWTVELDPDQITICFQNILLNACQAMAEGGTIYIRARNRELGPTNPFGLPPGPYVEIEVEDTGPGIPEDTLPHIFEPFFTTKEGGSGLGLFTCRRIVEAHGGKILAESPPGKGAIFRIFLPAKPEEVRKSPERPTVSESPLPSARVLIMDDEEGVRESMAEILRLSEFEVETAESGEQALETFRQALERGRAFDLVILDLTVPGGMGGRELLPRLRELDPKVKAIVVSGYSQDPVMGNHHRFGFNGALIKPFSYQTLMETVKKVLSESS